MYFNFGCATEAVNTALETKTGRELTDLKEFIANDITAATESIDRVTKVRKDNYTSKYLTYLINKVESRADKVNWGSLPTTKGNILRWELNQYITQVLDICKTLYKNTAASETTRLATDLYNNIVKYRADFEYGYKTGNRFIILTYQSACFACVDVTLLALIEAENEILGSGGMGIIKDIKPSQSAKTLMKSARSLNTCFSNGEWSKIVKAYRTANINTLKSNTYERAMESVASVAAFLSTAAIIAAISITGAIAIVGAIRGLITIYYRTAVTIDTKARSMQAYLAETMPYESNVSALEKQRKAHASLDKVAGFIEANIIKDDKRASDEIFNEDKTGLSPASLNQIEPVGEISEYSFS